ncbi:MAG: response regulator [Oligoflexales bacterium]
MEEGIRKILIVDDDEIYGRILGTEVRSCGLESTVVNSLLDLGSVGRLSLYDAAIIDFHLDKMKGDEIAEYIDKFLLDVPVVMISADESMHARLNQWPRPVKGFVSKKVGPPVLIQKVMDILDGRGNDLRTAYEGVSGK